MFKYKKLLVVAYDQEKTQSALAHVSQILSENNVSFVTYTPKTDLPTTDGIDLIIVIGALRSQVAANSHWRRQIRYQTAQRSSHCL